MAQQKGAIVVVQLFGRLESQLQKRVDGLAGGILRDLGHHGRHQVEGLPHCGEFFQHAHHAVVVLERVHARPRQFVLAGNQVLIKRLVHVPEEAQVYLRHLS